MPIQSYFSITLARQKYYMVEDRSLLGVCPLYISGTINFSLIVDLAKFMTVLFLFLVGFSFLITAMNTPFFDTTEVFILNFYLYLTFSVPHYNKQGRYVIQT
jgi:hypothetical protein